MLNINLHRMEDVTNNEFDGRKNKQVKKRT